MVYTLESQRFGRLEVIRRVENNRSYQTRWLCRCECGTEKIITGYKLTQGHTKSCGCLRRETKNLNYPGRDYSGKNNARFIHGHALVGNTSQEYQAWMNMRRRCASPTSTYYENYGGRGIRVCKRWLHSFKNFLADMGRKPHPSLTLERKNNDGNYTPRNCKWATRAEQNANRRLTSRGGLRLSATGVAQVKA